MPIKYPTEIEISGPWLLDDQALLQLDDIVEHEWFRLESRRKSLIEIEAKERVQNRINLGFKHTDTSNEEELLEEFIRDPSYSLARNRRQISLFLKSKGTYETDKFSYALRDNSLLDEVITGFSVDIESADIRCRMYTKSWANNLVVDASPDTANEAREVFVSLRNWAEKNSAPRWQQIWKNLSDANWYIWLLVMLLSVFIWFFTLPDFTDSAKEKAKALLENGITQENSIEAIQLLLIMETKYDPTIQPVKREVPSWFKIIFWSGLGLNISLLFRARNPLLGIGKGKKLISNWNTWYKLIGITIPGLIFASIIWPLFIEWMNKLIE